jgi:Flp pilus assembly protein TadD
VYGDALIHNGRPEEGLEQLNHAIKLTPNSRMAWAHEFVRAEALIHLGRFDAARIDLQRAELHDAFYVHIAYLAGVEALTGNLSEARRLMDHVKTLAPDFTAVKFRQFYNFISTDNGGANFEKMFDALEAAMP